MYCKYIKIILLLFSYFTSRCSCIDNLLKIRPITIKTFMYWPNATVPFYIQPNHFDSEQMLTIMTALSKFAFKTCLKFAPVMDVPDENQHVMVFSNPDGMRRCKVIAIGHTNAPHIISLGYDCLQSPHLEMIIMRALGFPFEHNRMSRDVYIDVLVENIEPSSVDLFTKESILPHELRELPYDINSVMHFGEREYSKNGHKTIMFKNRNIRQNRVGLSSTDLRKVEIVYGPECVARDRQEKVELCQAYPGLVRKKRQVEPPANKSLRVNPDITPPPSLLAESPEPTQPAEEVQKDQEAEYLNEVLDYLGIANETEEIIEQVYKISATALRTARGKYCNISANATVPDMNLDQNIKRRNSSDLMGIIEIIADYSRSMVVSAIKDLTVFCQNSEGVEAYERQCNFNSGNARCPKTYRSTKFGAVRYSTQHNPVYKQQTRYVFAQKYSYDKNRRVDGSGETTTPLAPVRKKRAAPDEVESKQENVKEKKSHKEKKSLKAKKDSKDELDSEKENDTMKSKIMTSSSSKSKEKDDKKKKRRFFKGKRYKVKNPQDASAADWEESNVSLDKDAPKKGAEGDGQGNKDQEIEVDQNDDDIEKAAEKVIDKEELVKEVLNEGLDKILDKTTAKKKASLKPLESKKEVKEESNEEEIAPAVLEVLDVEESDEAATQKKKRNKISADNEALDYDFEKTREKDAGLGEEGKYHMKKRTRQRKVPKTVKLNKLNQEFYNERKWPDGVVRYVIKRIPEYDLEDLRNRLAEVNSILLKNTCVRLHEVDAQEADGYDDHLVLDTSPDYVTGRVGGKQIFGCVELFKGGQHRQHTAMMVMAMLGFYFEVSRHDRDRYIRVHNRHIRPDKLHHFEKIRDEATLDMPYDYKSATHPAWQFWRKIGKTGISTVATYKAQDPDGSIMRALGQNEKLLSDGDLLKINSVYGVDCFLEDSEKNKRASNKKRTKTGQSGMKVLQ